MMMELPVCTSGREGAFGLRILQAKLGRRARNELKSNNGINDEIGMREVRGQTGAGGRGVHMQL